MTSRGCCEMDCEACCACDCGIMERIRQIRNPLSSGVAGLLFAVAWWIVIDAGVIDGIEGPDYLCGVGATVGLFMFNSISIHQGDSSMYTSGAIGSVGARVFLFLGLLVSFGSAIAAVWVMILHYIEKDNVPLYPGVALCVQNFLILGSSAVFKFGRSGETW
eukprot:m.27997 g.27997  ORF g.27997 m.27997 type:complete len:162 (-) comp4485_c0_seq1:66-551(-)